MKALVLKAHGEIDDLAVVDDYPKPDVTAGHVVLRVRASSFNFHDVFTVKGMPGIKVPLPVVPGLDMAGDIVEVGDGVADWQVGDRVLVNPLNKAKGLMGEMLDGGMAEFCRVAADQLIRMPDAVDYVDAAALPVAYGTAHRMLVTHKTVKAGDRVLVLGASGGVGTGCVMLAKHLGAEVIACAGSADKMARLTALGADHVVNYHETDWSKWAVQTFGKPQRRSFEGRRRRRRQLYRRRHLGALAALSEARRYAPRLRRHSRLRSEGGSSLHLELRVEGHRLQQLL